MTEMTKTILAGLKDNVKRTIHTPPFPHSDTHIPNPNRNGYRARAVGGPSKYKWDSQWHPFCSWILVSPATVGQVSGPPKADPPNHDVKISGICPQVTVKVDDVDVQLLVDTGSQVTLFSESLCNKLFKGKEQREGLSWLKLRAAYGLSIPYTFTSLQTFRLWESEFRSVV